MPPDVITFYEGVNDAARGNPSVNVSDRTILVGSRKSAIVLVQAGYGFMRDHLVTVAFIDSIRQNMIAEPTFTRDRLNGT